LAAKRLKRESKDRNDEREDEEESYSYELGSSRLQQQILMGGPLQSAASYALTRSCLSGKTEK